MCRVLREPPNRSMFVNPQEQENKAVLNAKLHARQDGGWGWAERNIYIQRACRGYDMYRRDLLLRREILEGFGICNLGANYI